MAEKETRLGEDVQLAMTQLGGRLWRNNSGVAKFEGGHTVKYGVGTGGSDYIGILPVTVTPAMVGQTVGVFVAVETKTGRKTPTDDQSKFLKMITRLGGIAVWGSKEEAIMDAFQKWKGP